MKTVRYRVPGGPRPAPAVQGQRVVGPKDDQQEAGGKGDAGRIEDVGIEDDAVDAGDVPAVRIDDRPPDADRRNTVDQRLRGQDELAPEAEDAKGADHDLTATGEHADRRPKLIAELEMARH